MDEAKAILRVAAQADRGTEEEKNLVIEAFLALLMLYFTPAALGFFSAGELRRLYLQYVQDLNELGLDDTVTQFMRHIGIFEHPRKLPRIEPPVNVVSIFKN